MKVTIEHYDITASVDVGHDDLCLEDVLEDLIIPALVGVGFDKEGIHDAMAEYCDCECECCKDKY